MTEPNPRRLRFWSTRDRAAPEASSAIFQTLLQCPAARCARCGYEFPASAVVAVCPRCLETFSREACFGGCWSCPLLPAGRTCEE